MKYRFGLIIFCFFLLKCAPKQTAYLHEIKEHRLKLVEEFLSDERAPLKTDDQLQKLAYFDAKTKYICNCTFTEDDAKRAFEMPTYSGINKPFFVFGKVACSIDGKKFELSLYKSMRQTPLQKNLLFLPFKDKTNDISTYGGGRYMDFFDHDIHNGQITIDFNKAYNPWCAYSDGFNCPIPPVANHLNFEIKAGEKAYKK